MVVDQGGMSSVMNIHYEKEELEGELYPHLKGTHSDGLLFCLFDSPVLKLTVLLAWVTLLMSVGFSGSVVLWVGAYTDGTESEFDLPGSSLKHSL